MESLEIFHIGGILLEIILVPLVYIYRETLLYFYFTIFVISELDFYCIVIKFAVIEIFDLPFLMNLHALELHGHDLVISQKIIILI